MGENLNAIEALLQDHQEVRQLFTEIASKTGEDKQTAFQRLVFELARHETAEEEVIYPLVRRDVDGGDDLADARIKEEDEAKKVLADLEKLDVSSTEFDTKFEQFRTAVLAHAESEETQVFPQLREVKDDDSLNAVGRVLDLAKKTAPTHPHPNVPGTATANLLAGPMAAVIDRTRDAIRDARQKLAS
ncbi:MAG TPA: hemerythrin domain-containing protein [Acidimicrobiales bacterium]|nr:hemerythrin domain-containing protein [Acidimicrobiales bacterium]